MKAEDSGSLALPPIPSDFVLVEDRSTRIGRFWMWGYPGAPVWQRAGSQGEAQRPNNIYIRPRSSPPAPERPSAPAPSAEPIQPIIVKAQSSPDQYAALKGEELFEVLLDRSTRDLLCIAVKRDETHLTLMMGDLSRIEIPLAFFRPSGDGTTPDFNDLHVIDYGQTVKFGPYEAAVDAIVDEAYQRARAVIQAKIEGGATWNPTPNGPPPVDSLTSLGNPESGVLSLAQDEGKTGSGS